MKVNDFFARLYRWETWHYLAKYIPLMPAWLWYCIRSRSFWFFTPSNPTLTFGGFEGESKKEMYDQLPPGTFPKTVVISHNISFDQAVEIVNVNNFVYPFAVKPDVGMMGFMFRTISNEQEFNQYHQLMPADYLVQEFVDYPLELSVFYYRFPNEKTGHITGFIRKDYLTVTGDGTSTLLELINIELTDDTRPRISSGVVSWNMVPRTITLRPSKAPLKRRAAKEIQYTSDSPNTMIEIPKPATASSIFNPCCLRIGNRVRNRMVEADPISAAAFNQPKAMGPVFKIVAATSGIKATTPPNNTANKSSDMAPNNILL